MIFLFDHKVGLRGTSFSWKGVTVLAELQFVHKMAAPSKPMFKGAPMEEEFRPNFVSIRQEVPRLVQENPPPGLIPVVPDSEISEDGSDEEEER